MLYYNVRDLRTVLAGADVGSAYDPASDPLPHGLAAAVENKRCYFCGRPFHKRS